MNFPLEELLSKICDDSYAMDFPSHSDNYFEKYSRITDKLKKSVYGSINLGLATASEDAGVYTDHGADHFDEVVKYAGVMLGLNSRSDVESALEDIKKSKWYFNPYEIYLLLLSIRFHDVGNIYGREGHERLIIRVMMDIGNYELDDHSERNLIARIAGAHGGKTPDGSKDTIGQLSIKIKISNAIEINPQRIASIVRFSDEICENRSRRHSSLLQIPPENEIFHKYISSIKTNCLSEGVFDIHFDCPKEDVVNQWGKKVNNKLERVFLTDEIMARLKKMELERRYCNKFLPAEVRVNKISVEVEVYESGSDEDYHHKVVAKENFSLEETGYPSDSGDVLSKEVEEKIRGENLKRFLS